MIDRTGQRYDLDDGQRYTNGQWYYTDGKPPGYGTPASGALLEDAQKASSVPFHGPALKTEAPLFYRGAEIVWDTLEEFAGIDAHTSRDTLIAYLKMKVDAGDWHAVSDAANDLRVMEARGT